MVLVKICGITNAADARAACEAGANSLGFNFYPKSPRFIAKADAAKIRTQLPNEVEAVGVFVNLPAPEIAELHRELRFNAVQLNSLRKSPRRHQAWEAGSRPAEPANTD